MGESSRKIDPEKLMSYSDDLIQVLRDKKDATILDQSIQHARALLSSCDADSSELESLLRDYQRKIDECKEKTEAARSEVVADSEIDRLQSELQEELEKERLLMENLRAITNEIDDFDQQRVSIEEEKQILKKIEQDELRQQMTLSMYASVTNIIPNLDDDSIVRGYIVDREKKVVDKFEFNSIQMPAYDACSKLWKKIDNS